MNTTQCKDTGNDENFWANMPSSAGYVIKNDR